jgi:acyl carrier protein
MNYSAPAPTTDAGIRNKIYAVIAAHAKLDVATLKPDSTLKDLGIASLTAIEALFDIEEIFDIDFPDRGPNFDGETLQELVDTVQAAVRARGASKSDAA